VTYLNPTEAGTFLNPGSNTAVTMAKPAIKEGTPVFNGVTAIKIFRRRRA